MARFELSTTSRAAAQAKGSNEMTKSMHSFNHGLAAQPLHRLAMEAPEQLEPCLRRAAFRMARRRFTAWLREVLAAAGTTKSMVPTA
jgi:hypothetical protein